MLQGVRSPLWPMWFPVYASIVSFGFLVLLNNCNTRYEWLVRPYSTGTFTLQETPSFAWRTNGLAHLPSFLAGVGFMRLLGGVDQITLSLSAPGWQP